MQKKVDILKKKGIDLNHVNKKGLNHLIILSSKNKEIFYKEHKSYRPNDKLLNSKILDYALKKKLEDIQKYLLRKPFKIDYINEETDNLLQIAVQFASLEVIKTLIKFNVDANYLNEFGQNALVLAINRNNLNIVKAVCEKTSKKGKNIECEESGLTPLTQSITESDYEIFEYLVLDQDIDINLENYYGETPLFTATSKNIKKHAKFLCQQKDIQIDKTNLDSLTPFSDSCIRGHFEIVKDLVEIGKCNINYQDKSGQTGLGWAVIDCHIDIVKYLLQLDSIDIKTTDNKGKNIYQYSKDLNWHEIEELLKPYFENRYLLNKF